MPGAGYLGMMFIKLNRVTNAWGRVLGDDVHKN